MEKDKAKVIEIVGTASERVGGFVGKATVLGKRIASVAADDVSAGKGMLGLEQAVSEVKEITAGEGAVKEIATAPVGPEEVESSMELVAQREPIDVNVENVEESELKSEAEAKAEVEATESAEVTPAPRTSPERLIEQWQK